MEDVKNILGAASAACENKMEKMEKIQQLVDNTLRLDLITLKYLSL